ncbi:MarR family transcriptional regulator [Saccharopolyspora sp. NFXS83]|uniref:MarR family winged helix-turn-helix transcriptional regulator n=1 Tax=Saccharopolyspora sp. NFXS83 TaxID=2993560 RepID=UPI00224AE282|nr:MarR family transcriptional regulator [Saccharopolyspora sp. NFXS83]MCX2730159.1 MarR family transcriptional regulator [Saccharopolyspora sp. NFXS83]
MSGERTATPPGVRRLEDGYPRTVTSSSLVNEKVAMSFLQARTIELWDVNNPDLDTSPMAVVALVNRIAAVLEQATEQLYDSAALTPAEVKLLVPLRYLEEPVTAAYLAAQLGMSRAGVSKTLAKLEKRGFIARSAKPADRRATLISITPEAERAIGDVFPRELEAHARLLAGLGRERDTVLTSLHRLADTMESRMAGGNA